MTYSHIINNRIYNAGSIETLIYERRESTAKWRMLSLVFFISHKAVKIPFFCVFLLIRPSVPGSGVDTN